VRDLIISAISIYPNPGVDQLVINKEGHTGLQYNIYSLTGNLVSTGRIHPTHQGLINTTDWYSGMYIIAVRDGEGRSLISKWVKL